MALAAYRKLERISPAPANGWLVKPVAADELIAVIKQVLPGA
jgi:DNA-binding response OmpR family regulator